MNNSPITIAAGKEFVIDDCKNPIGQYISYVNEIYELEMKINQKEGKKNDIKGKSSKHFFFRGQSNKKWELQPSVLRNTKYNEKGWCFKKYDTTLDVPIIDIKES